MRTFLQFPGCRLSLSRSLYFRVRPYHSQQRFGLDPFWFCAGNSKDVFHKACVEHDYCYRHGYATYGLDQRYCDNRFYGDMMEECGSAGGGILGLTDVDGLAERAKCRLAADQFYAAVQRYGSKAFRTTGSTRYPFDGAEGPR